MIGEQKVYVIFLKITNAFYWRFHMIREGDGIVDVKIIANVECRLFILEIIIANLVEIIKGEQGFKEMV